MSVSSSPRIPRYTRFEAMFVGAKDYANPFQDVRVQVTFHCQSSNELATPIARTVDAFWDGERTWRVRFSPEELGHWSYCTIASDATNHGLHGQVGGFDCVPYEGSNPLYRHGPLRVSRSRTHLEHADGTPFFWLADTCWCGSLLSQEADWSRYLEARKLRRFNVIQFMGTQSVAAGGDAQGRQAYTDHANIAIDPYFFRRLDQRVDAINDAGLMGAPTFAWAAQHNFAARQLNPGVVLPDDQLIAFGRYFVSRYGAHQVAWLFAGDFDYRPPAVAERWRRIGDGIFPGEQARLVTVHPYPQMVTKTEFGGSTWHSFYGYQSGHSTNDEFSSWVNRRGPGMEWATDPVKPVINLEPIYEAHHNFGTNCPATALEVRRTTWWSTLVTPPAGVSYGGHGVWSWETQPAVPPNHPRIGVARPWHEALDLPGGIQVSLVRKVMESLPWTMMRPALQLVLTQPGDRDVQNTVVGVMAREQRIALFYFPSSTGAVLDLSFASGQATMCWIDPTTGIMGSSIPLAVPGDSVKIAPPGLNAAGDVDWLLLVR